MRAVIARGKVPDNLAMANVQNHFIINQSDPVFDTSSVTSPVTFKRAGMVPLNNLFLNCNHDSKVSCCNLDAKCDQHKALQLW